MAHTQHNHPRTPSAQGGGGNRNDESTHAQAQNDPARGQGTKVTNSPRKRAPQAPAGKRHE